MDELEPFATALRAELGAPPESWQKAQAARLRDALRQVSKARAVWRVFLPRVAAVVAVLGVVTWFAARYTRSATVDRWLVAEELAEPFRFEDGSSIALAPGGRGRVAADQKTVRFDLHSGSARFDVPPGRGRTWQITAGKNEVRVVGTRFSVSYDVTEAFEVGVERGIVSVRVPERKASVELTAGDRLRGRPGKMEVVHGAPGQSSLAPPSPTNQAEAQPASAALAPSESTPMSSESAPPANRRGSEPADSDWQADYRAGKYAESLTRLRSSGLLQRLQDASPATLATVADAARLGGDPELAVRTLNLLVQRFPRAPEARPARFLLGRVHAVRGDRSAAIAAFERYLEDGGSAAYSSEALGRLVELYLARGERQKAHDVALRYLERAPQGPYHRLARSLVAEPK